MNDMSNQIRENEKSNRSIKGKPKSSFRPPKT